MRSFIILLIVLAFQSCKEATLTEIPEYEGPLREANNVETLYAEDNLVKLKMIAAEVLEFQSGDREFPKGIYLEFYNEEGQLSTILKANQAHFSKEKNLWRGWDNVEVKNIINKEQLNTEELYWKPDEERIFTDKFVTIRLDKEVLYGTGLEAKQDFTSYTIKDPQGEFVIED